MKRMNSRGDTIMEVLISMAVLGLILASSYALVTRSTSANISANERGQASKLAIQQIELLKIYAENNANNMPSPSYAFCLTIDTVGAAVGQIRLHQFFGSPPPPQPNDDIEFDSPAYPPECSLYNGLFYFYIQRGGPGLPGDSNTYTAHVRWPASQSDRVNEAELIQKIYPGANRLGSL